MRYQGLLLAAGQGRRLSGVADGVPKALVKVAGETLIEHNLRRLYDVGLERVVVVVGYLAEAVIEHLEAGPYRDRLEFVTQTETLGTGHAVAISREALHSEPFVLCYCDNYTPYRLDPLIGVHESQQNAVTFAVFRASEPKNHGIMQIEGDQIVDIVERPEHPVGNLAFAGMGVFEGSIYDAVDRVHRAESGEYYLTDAVMGLADSDVRVGYDILNSFRININSPKQLEVAVAYAVAHPAEKTV